MHTRYVQGLFYGLIAVYLLTAVLLLAPVHIWTGAALTLQGGRAMIRIRFLMLKLQLPIRLHLLEKPCLTLERLHHDGHADMLFVPNMVKPPSPPFVIAALEALEGTWIHMEWLVGTGDAARTAVACGTLAQTTEKLLQQFLPGVQREIVATPQFAQTCFRLNMEGIATLRLAEIIRKRFKL